MGLTLVHICIHRCTSNDPSAKGYCDVGEAPVCKSISEGGWFDGKHTAPAMVSTFSWSGWCDVTRGHRAVACPPSPWAACMTAPCRLEGGSVRCDCPVFNSSWIDFGPGESARGERCSGMVSTVPAGFHMSVMPGAEYALDACEALGPASV